MKKTFFVLLGGLLLAGGGCFSSNFPSQPIERVEVKNTTTSTKQPVSEKSNTTKDLVFPGELPSSEIDNKQIRMETDKGVIVFELLSDTAPLAVSNFVYLSNKGYYDGLTFHRVESSLNIIQGGDPSGNGTGGPGYRFNDELDDDLNYDKGMVAMANSGPNTNGSQFFIMTDDFAGFQKNYTIFGRVLEGVDVANEIVMGDKMMKVEVEDLEK